MVFWSSDLELTSLAYGLLLGFVGAALSGFGLSVWASIAYTRRNAKQLLGEDGAEAQGKVLAKKLSTKDENLVQQPNGTYQLTKTYYLVSYVFDGLRADGATCRVEVRERKVPSFVWEGLKEGEAVGVRYLKQEPRQCRLTKAAQHEQKGPLAMRVRAAIGLLFFTGGLIAAVLSVLDHHIAGMILYASVVFVSMLWQLAGRRFLQAVCPCCRSWLVRWSPLFVHPGFVIMKELGKDVEPGQKLEPVLPSDVEIASFEV